MKNMFQFLFSLKGNAKSCLLTEPLWGIPFNLYAPFITLYMYHLGVMDFEIGLIMFVGRIVQMICAILGGILTDKFGRRLVTFIFDILSWSVPALIWAFSQNFWWFLVAAVVNGLWHITAISWECLWVDDTEESKIGSVFNWIYVAGLLAVFFAPISGYFVHIYGVVPVVRVLYIITFISMTAKFVILYFFSTETERGKERMAATKDIPMWRMLVDYKNVVVQIFKSVLMVRSLVLQAIINVILLVTSTFFALYVTQDLGIPDSFLAYFPILRAAVMLLFLLAIQEKLNNFKMNHILIFGLVVYIISTALILGAPSGSWLWIAIYIVVEACAAALFLPRLDTIVTNAIDPTERARIRGTFNMMILAVSSVFILFAGYLAEIDRRLPFALNLILFLIMVCVILIPTSKKRGSSEA